MDAFREWLRDNAGEEVVFVSNPGNAGDAFIAHATFTLFKRYGISWRLMPDSHGPLRGRTIVLGGGGNLIEGLYSDTSQRLEQIGPNDRCVIFPHTIVGNVELLRGLAGRVTVFCRDPKSYYALRERDVEGVHLVHDVTLYLDDEDIRLAVDRESAGTAFVFRTDRESTGLVALPPDNVDISRSWDGNFWDDPAFAMHTTMAMAAYLSRFREVHTDRLHVAILSCFLGKRVTMYRNSYYKNEAIYFHSLVGRFPTVTLSPPAADAV